MRSLGKGNFSKWMSVNKIKSISDCVGGKHYSANVSTRGDFTQNKKQEHMQNIESCFCNL